MTLKIETLSRDGFAPFGSYLDPEDCGPPRRAGALEFHPDTFIMRFPTSNVLSACSLTVKPRPMVVDVTETHLETEEIIGGFGAELAFHVGLSRQGEPLEPDMSTFRIFRLPAGWYARFKRGVYHHGPFVTGEKPAHGLVLLPPVTYSADCIVVKLDQPIAIEN